MGTIEEHPRCVRNQGPAQKKKRPPALVLPLDPSPPSSFHVSQILLCLSLSRLLLAPTSSLSRLSSSLSSLSTPVPRASAFFRHSSPLASRDTTCGTRQQARNHGSNVLVLPQSCDDCCLSQTRFSKRKNTFEIRFGCIFVIFRKQELHRIWIQKTCSSSSKCILNRIWIKTI